ncbi:MAG: IS5 family transposase [bacterium]|nr:IS5 family transposase [bacterium]
MLRANWQECDRGLVQRGDITIWLTPEAVASWNPTCNGKRGGQRRYSDLAIETALTLRLVFHLPLRQAEGFLGSLFNMMGVDLGVPDHTTLSRRGRDLNVKLHRVSTGDPIHLIVDSTGLSIVGQGEWAAAKHGGNGKRGWKKLHPGVDEAGVIVAQLLTESNIDDATNGEKLIDAVVGPIARVIGDAAYDTVSMYESANGRGAAVVVPPARTAKVSKRGPRSAARDRTIARVKEVVRRRWKSESGYHQQGRVENAMFRYKSIIGDRLRARTEGAQAVEAALACNVLNRVLELGRPASVAIGR